MADMTESAFDILKKTLAYFGLSDDALNTEVQKLWLNKTLTDSSTVNDVGILLKDTKAFKDRFPANAALAAAGKPQYSVAEYLRLESAYKAKLTAAGMPADFYDKPDDFQNWIANDVSPDEIGARIEAGYSAVKNASPQVIDQFKRLYGASEGDLAAYFIDPQRAKPTFDKYEAQRQARAAQVAAQAQTQAQIVLSQQAAEDLVRAGVTEEAAQAGFSDILTQQQLFGTTTTEEAAGKKAITQEEQISGTFGTNAEARQAIAKRKRERQAAFEQGGSFMPSQGGITGLGTVG